MRRAQLIAGIAIQNSETSLQICKVRAKAHGFFELANRFRCHTNVRVGLAQLGVHVRQLAFDERIDLGRYRARSHLRVYPSSGVVLAEVIVSDHQVELRFRVIGVEEHGFFEMRFRLREVARSVRDDAEHVMNVGVPVRLGNDLQEQTFRLVELAAMVVLSTEQQQLPDVVVHHCWSVLEKQAFYHHCFEPGRHLATCSVLALLQRDSTASPRG